MAITEGESSMHLSSLTPHTMAVLELLRVFLGVEHRFEDNILSIQGRSIR